MASPRSRSPDTPGGMAAEPEEEATSAEHGLSGDEKKDVPATPVTQTSVPPATDACILTDEILKEEEQLHQQTVQEAEEIKQKNIQMLSSSSDDLREERYKRLQFLLSKSNMYTEYLLERMKKQEIEGKKRQERSAKRAAKGKTKVGQEAVDDPVIEESGAAESRSSAVSPEAATEAAQAPRNTRSTRSSIRTANTAATDTARGKPKAKGSGKENQAKVEEKQASSADPVSKRRGTKRKASSDENYKISDYLGEAMARCKKQKCDEMQNRSESATVCESRPGGQGETTQSSSHLNNETVSEKEDSESHPSSQESTSSTGALSLKDNVPERIINGELAPEGQPELFVGGVLRPYQMEGFRWLRILYENGVNGILADEMGLGKTIQCIAILAHLVNQGVPGPFLVCAPLSTIPNWVSEFERFAPKVPVILYHGHKHDREKMSHKVGRPVTIRPGVEVMPVVITSYEIARVDRKLIGHHMWKYIIVDEGHRLKNHQCMLLKELKKYRSTNRLLLTGTPIQNNLSELWSLLNFLLPEIFDDLGSFEAWFDIEALNDRDGHQQLVAEEQKDKVLSMLHQILTPFLLRRLKTDVELVIPPKREIIVYAPLTKVQQLFYKATLDRTMQDWVDKEKEEPVTLDSRGRSVRKAKQRASDFSLMVGEEKEFKNKKKDEEDVEKWVQDIINMTEDRNKKQPTKQRKAVLNIKMQNIMMQLRKTCNHPYLLQYPLDPQTGEYLMDEQIVQKSGKMLLVDHMLQELKKKGHKVLIFSQMTKMLDIVEDYCWLRKFKYCRLDGASSFEERKEQIKTFNSDPDIFLFLLSTRAGGLGLNLTAADTVIIYDSDWNPQSDLQAQDRCHRIGQTRPVMIYRIVTANTIDQRVVERAAAKRKLEKLVIHKGRFKKGIDNWKSTLEQIGVDELYQLLESQDHHNEVGGQGQVISNSDLNQLLDRSDLYNLWQGTSTSKKGEVKSPVQIQKDVEGVFKVIHQEDGKIGLDNELAPKPKIKTVEAKTVQEIVASLE